MIWEPSGAYWDRPSLVWGERAGKGDVQSSVSPLGPEVQTFRLLTQEETDQLFQVTGPYRIGDLPSACSRLKSLFSDKKSDLTEAIRQTTAFNPVDCAEIFEGCLSFFDRFEVEPDQFESGYVQQGRRIGLRSVPWGTIAAVLPQNAFLSMALPTLFNGLAAGNRVVLRAPSGSARLAAMFGALLAESCLEPSCFSLVICDAAQFVNAWERAGGSALLHYMGSSGRAGELLAKSFSAGQPCLIDGEGNSYLYVDEDQDPEEAARLAWKGAIRYNGETCTSVNGIVVHPAIDSPFRSALRSLVAATSFGLGDEDEVGPVFNARQANAAEQIVQTSGGRMGRAGAPNGNIYPPTLVEDPALDSTLVREGLFAPATWIRSGDFQEFRALWKGNTYPLCASVLSFNEAVCEEACLLQGASRIVLNGDPSLEDPMEPWGGYPPCGSNNVSPWYQKYRRVIQVDQPV